MRHGGLSDGASRRVRKHHRHEQRKGGSTSVQNSNLNNNNNYNYYYYYSVRVYSSAENASSTCTTPRFDDNMIDRRRRRWRTHDDNYTVQVLSVCPSVRPPTMVRQNWFPGTRQRRRFVQWAPAARPSAPTPCTPSGHLPARHAVRVSLDFPWTTVRPRAAPIQPPPAPNIPLLTPREWCWARCTSSADGRRRLWCTYIARTFRSQHAPPLVIRAPTSRRRPVTWYIYIYGHMR